MGKRKKELAPEEISLLCQELEMFFSGGISLYDAFLIMTDNSASSGERELYQFLSKEIQSGSRLAEALEQTSRFPAYMIHMVRIGEDSGKLEDVFHALSLYYQRLEHMKNSIKSAVLYPVVMLLAMLLILAILFIKVLPVFSQVFDQVGAQFPSFLQTIADSGNAVAAVCIVILIVIAILIFLYFIAKRTEGGRQLLIKLYEIFPLTKKLVAKSESGKFTYSMSLLLSSGVNADEAMGIICDLTESPLAKKRISLLKELTDQGEQLPNALTSSKLLTSEYSAMIAVGLTTGNADQMMNLVAERYNRDTERWVDHLIAGIEPAIVMIMCIIIGSVLMSVMLPLMKIMTSI